MLPLQRKRKLDDNQTRLMQDNAKQSPDQKKRYIEEIVRDVAKFPSGE